jgi:hypothetical protein
MLPIDRFQMMTNEQLQSQIESYEKQMKIEQSMPKSARINHLSVEKDLELAKKELNKR